MWVGYYRRRGGGEQARRDRGGGRGGICTEQQGGNASHVRCSHRGTGDRVGGRRRGVPVRRDARARGEDIQAGAKVGVGGASIGTSGRADGNRGWLTGGRRRAGIGVGVAGRDAIRDTVGNAAGNCRIQQNGGGAAETHVGDRGGACCMVGGHPFDTCNHARVRAGAGTRQHAHGYEADALGDAVRGTTNGASDVGAVAVAVCCAVTVADRRVAAQHTPTEVVVRAQNAGINDVRLHARTRGGVRVAGVERQVALVEAVEAPRGGALRGVDADHAILLNARHRGILRERCDLAWREVGGKAVEGVSEDGERCGPGAARKHCRLLARHDRDDVAVRDHGADFGARRHGGSAGCVEGVELAIALDDQDLRVVAQPTDIGRVEAGDKTVDAVAEDLADVVLARLLRVDLAGQVGAIVEDHDVVLRGRSVRERRRHREGGEGDQERGKAAHELVSIRAWRAPKYDTHCSRRSSNRNLTVWFGVARIEGTIEDQC